MLHIFFSFMSPSLSLYSFFFIVLSAAQQSIGTINVRAVTRPPALSPLATQGDGERGGGDLPPTGYQHKT